MHLKACGSSFTRLVVNRRRQMEIIGCLGRRKSDVERCRNSRHAFWIGTETMNNDLFLFLLWILSDMIHDVLMLMSMMVVVSILMHAQITCL